MPPSGRRKARNKDVEPQSEADTPDAINTPSRKRRRTNGVDTDAKPIATTAAKRARRASAESDATIENLEDNAEEPNPFALAEEVIRHLRVATYAVGVATDHNNEVVQQSAQAFAKIAGREWTFYVSSLHVIIGRPNTKAKAETPGGGFSGTPGRPAVNDMTVDIDLGPDQQISRLHAEISYDTDRGEWFIIVNGRNGVIVDEHRLERGQKMWLRSGNVITVLGTQMMFMLPNETPEINENIVRSLLPDEDEEDEADAAEQKPPRGFASGPGRGRGGNAYQPSSQARPPPTQSAGRGANQVAVPASFQQPPVQPGTPVAHRHREQPQPKSRPSPAYARGLHVDNADEIDYSADGSKDIKPPHSYAQMIGQAILSTPEENATLARIYEFIKEKYAFFRFGGGGWQNSIRHNLSLSKHFEKIPRRTDEPGKGMKWQIVPEHRAEYMKKNFHDSRRAPRRVGSSGPSSPAVNMGPSAQTERLMIAMSGEAGASRSKASPRESTPPLSSYPAPNESFTPDRGPRTGSLQTANYSAPNANSAHSTPTQFRHHPLVEQPALSTADPPAPGRSGLTDAAIDSPPTLTGNQYDITTSGANLFTPMVPRQAPNPGILSTQKIPSFYAKNLLSSPAPFWKYVATGSTPARPPFFEDLSPEKMAKVEGDVPTDEDEEDEVEDEEMEDDAEVKEGDTVATKKEDDGQDEPGLPPPSSPPLAHAAGASSGGEGPDESPSRTISRPVSRREALGKKSLEPMPLFAPPKVGLNPALSGPAYNPYAVPPNDDEEEEGFDLQKGFEKIGAYHRTMQAASSITH